MSDNKVDNKLDFRNIKQTQLDRGQVLKGVFSELQSALRIYDTNAILKDAYTHFVQDLDGEDRPLKVTYYQATSPAQDRINFRADVGGDLAGKYFTIQEFISKKTYVFYYVVSGSGVAPGIGDVEVAINITNNDPATVVTYSTKAALSVLGEITVLPSAVYSSYFDISYYDFGEAQAVNTGTSGFLTSRNVEGQSFQVGEVEITYNIDGHPIYNGNVLKDLLFNPYTASFDTERSDITVTVDLSPLISKDPIIYNVAMALAGTEYSQVLPLETKRFQMNVQDHKGKYTVSWVSAGPVLTKSPGTIYEESGLEIVVGKETLYFTGTKDNIIMEIITWK